ncbi:glycosyltransferase family 2 protein [Neobacillus mesonae]|uniref:glycosyltransferase family 2 protein n=1 Tax=Neobacillus mesonae TaxID=1193713 RepID=UPI002E1D3126|nr:glycosyltransferase family 2 protein [Neobacillus mesonae]
MGFKRIPNLVSIVIGCYNSERHIEETLESLVSQTYRPIEIIVVNDGSSDRSDQVIRNWYEKEKYRFLDKDLQFVYLSLPYNTGFSGAFTSGYFLARGEFIATQAADDISHPERIEKQVKFMRNHPETGMVGTALAWFDDGKFDKPYVYDFVKYGWKNISKIYQDGGHCVCHGTTLFRGDIFDRLGGFERYPKGKDTIAEDYYFIHRYFQNGVRLENIPETLYYYRRYPEQRSQNGLW